MNQKKWEAIRAKGKRRYLLRYALLFSVISSSLTALIMATRYEPSLWRDWRFAMAFMLYSFLLGALIGNTLWKDYEKKYKEGDMS
jgi:Ni/Fe-hydrogenase subunit HybB-like protein